MDIGFRILTVVLWAVAGILALVSDREISKLEYSIAWGIALLWLIANIFR